MDPTQFWGGQVVLKADCKSLAGKVNEAPSLGGVAKEKAAYKAAFGKS